MSRLRRTEFVLIALFASLLAPLGTLAQEPAKPAPNKESAKESADKSAPTSKKPDTKLETIEVKESADTYDARKDDTATKIVVTAAEINKFGDTQLADVLKRLPGITVTGSTIRMRGLGGGYTQILIDGERAPPGFTIDQLSPTMIERIEILRAATAEFSTQSIAGTINIVLKKKISLAQREWRAGYARGSFFESYSTSFLVSDKKDNLGYTVNGFVYDNANHYPYYTSERGYDARGAQTLSREYGGRSEGKGHGGGLGPRLVWTAKNGDSLIWQSFINLNRGDGNNNFRYDVVIGTPVPITSTRTYYQYQNDMLRSDLNWISKLKDGSKLDIKFGLSGANSRNSNTTRGFNAADQQNLQRSYRTAADDRGLTFSGKYASVAVDGHALVGGWDASLNRRTEDTGQTDRSFPGVLPFIPPINRAEKFDADVLKLAAFAQDEWNITKEWSMYLGLRWESLTTTSAGDTYAEIRNRSEVWSPIAQTLYKLPGRKGEQVRLALTRTYKAPATNSLIPRLFSSVENTPTTPDYSGNPSLKPELATGVDVAIEKFWNQGASISLSGSVRRISDFNRRGLLFVNGRWVSLPINDGKATTRSLEFDTKFPWQLFWKEAPPIDFRLNMGRNWSTVSSVPGPNNRLDQQVPFSATLGLDYRMKNGVLVAGGSFSYRQGGEVRTSVTQASFLTAKRDLDLYALWKITPKTQFRLTLSNVLKPSETTRNSYFDANGSTNTTRITPSKMNIRAGIEVKF